jgi:hypothetical protein
MYKVNLLTLDNLYYSPNLSSLCSLEFGTLTRQLYFFTYSSSYSWDSFLPASQYSFSPGYVAQGFLVDSGSDVARSLFQEKTSNYRFLRLMNPVFKYDFKVGNYMPDDTKKMNPHLFRTIQDLTTGVRKSS